MQGRKLVPCFTGQWILLLLMCCVALPCNADIYRWTNERGEVFYGDKNAGGAGKQKLDLKVQKSDWQKFVVEIDDVDGILTDEEKERISRDINTIYEFFDRRMYFDIYKTVPVKIRLFRDKEDYQNYLLMANVVTPENRRRKFNSRGIYFPQTNEIVLPLNSRNRYTTFKTIRHETSHAIVDTLTPFVPAWLNEGLAENMETIYAANKGFVIKPHRENYDVVAAAIGKNRKIDLQQFLQTRSSDFYRQMNDSSLTNQSVSAELVRMLLASTTGKSFLVRLIHAYERGSRRFSASLVDEHFIGGLDALQNDWNAWVARGERKEIGL